VLSSVAGEEMWSVRGTLVSGSREWTLNLQDPLRPDLPMKSVQQNGHQLTEKFLKSLPLS